MIATYKPIYATQEMQGHTFDEFFFALNLNKSIDNFFKILSGEKKGCNARDFFAKLAKEVEELVDDE